MKVTNVKTAGGYKLALEFDDGTSGVVDLADYAGIGVFETWTHPGFFDQVRITDEGALAWPGDLDLCPDALYLRLTGKSVEEVFPGTKRQLMHA